MSLDTTILAAIVRLTSPRSYQSMSEARCDVAGCLDAPSSIPSGSVKSVRLGPHPDEWGFETEVLRELVE